MSRKQITAKTKVLREPKTQLKNTNISQLSKPDMEGNFNAAGKLFYYYICLSQILKTQLKALKTSTLNLHPAPHRGRSGFCPLFLIVFTNEMYHWCRCQLWTMEIMLECWNSITDISHTQTSPLLAGFLYTWQLETSCHFRGVYVTNAFYFKRIGCKM